MARKNGREENGCEKRIMEVVVDVRGDEWRSKTRAADPKLRSGEKAKKREE